MQQIFDQFSAQSGRSDGDRVEYDRFPQLVCRLVCFEHGRDRVLIGSSNVNIQHVGDRDQFRCFFDRVRHDR